MTNRLHHLIKSIKIFFFKKNITRKKEFYFKIVFLISLVLVLSVLFTSTILIFNFEKQLIKTHYQHEEQKMNYTAHSISIMMENQYKVYNNLIGNLLIKKLLYFKTINLTEQAEGFSQLEHIRNLSGFLNSIYIYNSLNQTFYISSKNPQVPFMMHKDNFFDQELIDLYNQNNDRVTRPLVRIINEPLSHNSTKPVPVYSIIYSADKKTKSLENKAFIVLNISVAWLKKTIDTYDQNPENSIFIIDENRTVVLPNRNYAFKESVKESQLETKLYSVINHYSNIKKSGYLIIKNKEQKNLVAYHVYSQIFDWTFIKMIALKSLEKNILLIRIYSLCFIMICLMIGLYSVFMTMKRISRPINSLIDEMNITREKNQKYQSEQKQKVLKELLLWSDQSTENEIFNILREYRIDLSLDKRYDMIIFVMDQYAGFVKHNSYQDKTFFNNEMIKYLKNCFLEWGQCIILGIENGQFVILIEKEEKTAAIKKDFILQIQDSILSLYKASFSVILSDDQIMIANFGVIYQKYLKALSYRYILGYKCIINLNQISEFEQVPFKYPSDIDALINQAIMEKKFDEALGRVCQILSALKNTSSLYFIATQNRLTNTIYLALNNIISRIHSVDFYTFNQKINSCEILEEVISTYRQFFNDLKRDLIEKKIDKKEEQLNKIIEYVLNHYHEISLWSASIADQVNLSQVYLLSFFKKQTNTSLPDFINKVRIDKAKELLKNTNYPINQIFTLVGYSNEQYFYKIFKKLNGITPNEYRNKD